MKNTTRRVLILKNVNSELIEQAILILKDSAPCGDSRLIREAEKIVEKYMDKNLEKSGRKNRQKTALILSLGMAFIGISIALISFFA